MSDERFVDVDALLDGVQPGDDAALEEIARALPEDTRERAWRDPRFVDWCAADARAVDRRQRRESDAAFMARGRELVARAQARRLRVRRGAPLKPVTSTARAVRERQPGRTVQVVDLGVAAGIGRELWDEPPQAFAELPAEVPDGRYIALRIVGDSMTPLMHTGDVVLVNRHGELRADTVVVARHPDDGYVCKKVQRVRRDTIELASLDPGRPLITIPRDADLVLGTVIMVCCGHRAV